MKIKITSSYTDEELLSLLEKEDLIEDTKETEVSRFLSFFNIHPGNNQVYGKFLYELFKSWSKATVKAVDFNTELKKYFDYKDETRTIFYIDKIKVKLSEHAKSLIKKPKKYTRVNKNYRQHFEFFLKAYGIKKGTCWVRDKVLYQLYKTWNLLQDKTVKMSLRTFREFLELYIEHKSFVEKESTKYYFKVDNQIKRYVNEKE